jgi:hypothetical protein
MIHFELPQVLKIVLEVQLKRSNEKIAKKKISIYKTCLFSFFLYLDPSYFQSF